MNADVTAILHKTKLKIETCCTWPDVLFSRVIRAYTWVDGATLNTQTVGQFVGLVSTFSVCYMISIRTSDWIFVFICRVVSNARLAERIDWLTLRKCSFEYRYNVVQYSQKLKHDHTLCARFVHDHHSRLIIVSPYSFELMQGENLLIPFAIHDNRSVIGITQASLSSWHRITGLVLTLVQLIRGYVHVRWMNSCWTVYFEGYSCIKATLLPRTSYTIAKFHNNVWLNISCI